MTIVNSLHMPQPLVVLGMFYAIFALVNFLGYVKAGYWSGMWSEMFYLLKSRFLSFLGIIGLLLLIITFLDKPVSQFCKDFYNVNVYTSFDFICSMAEGWFVYGVLFTAMLFCEYLGKAKPAIVLKISLMASTYVGLVNGTIKFLFNRQRPSIGLKPWNFFHFFINGGHNYSDLLYAYNSMASGHTITVVSAITPIFLYSKKKVYKFLLIIYAILVGMSRIYTLNHWLSDVCTAAILGVILGWVCYKNNKFRLG